MGIGDGGCGGGGGGGGGGGWGAALLVYLTCSLRIFGLTDGLCMYVCMYVTDGWKGKERKDGLRDYCSSGIKLLWESWCLDFGWVF